MLAWARPQPILYAVGLLLAAAGAAVRIWAAGTLHKSRQVTTSGPYAWVRHPLYLGSFLIAFGYMLMSGRWQAVAIGVPLFLLFHGAAITIEEKMLLKLFGQEYADYARAVPRLLPRRLPANGGPAMGTFSWERVLYNREPFNLIGVLILAALFGLRLALHR
jgi:protein-S-isoprenylcysteine O-methyltransferase Ste14